MGGTADGTVGLSDEGAATATHNPAASRAGLAQLAALAALVAAVLSFAGASVVQSASATPRASTARACNPGIIESTLTVHGMSCRRGVRIVRRALTHAPSGFGSYSVRVSGFRCHGRIFRDSVGVAEGRLTCRRGHKRLSFHNAAL